MNSIVVKGGMLVTPIEERMADIWTDGERIACIGTDLEPAGKQITIDAGGCYVTPGLFDLQVNGGPGCSFWDELTKSSVQSFSDNLLGRGVTSILPTIITGPIDRLVTNRDFLKREFGISLKGSCPDGSPVVRMPGIHLEGPCLSKERPGVHPQEHLQPLSIGVLEKIIDQSVKLITVAPELDPSGKALEYLKSAAVVVSLGHSNANLEEANRAFDQGVSLITHIFNALPAIHHRNPGAVTAALLDSRVVCCIICDGLHVNPAAAELVYRLKGVKSTILVTDIAQVGTSQGGLVGSSLFLDQAVRNVVEWGICSFREAICMASYNPAKALGLTEEIGSLKPGAYADFVLWDRKTLAVRQVVFNGRALKT